MFCYYENDTMVELDDKELTTKLLPLFYEAAKDIINNVEVNNSVINQVDSTTIVKPSEEEKQNLQNMLSKLGL